MVSPEFHEGCVHEGCVAEDLACIRCGYNLRTLHYEAKCPECGIAVSQSIKGNWLRNSYPAWLKKVSGGLTWIIYVFGMSLACGTRVLVPPVFDAIRKAVGRSTFDFEVATVFVLSGLVGLWQFTTPEPRRIGPPSAQDRRRVVRFSGCASVFAIAAILLVGPKTPMGLKLCPVAGLLLVAWCAAVWLYIRELALRIPDAREARRARILFIGFLVVIGISVWSAVATLAGRGSGTIVHFLGAGGWLGLVVFFMFLLQLARFALILKGLAANARTADSTDKSS